MFDPIRQELEAENTIGLLIGAQLGASPSELNVIVRTATADRQTGAIHTINQYLITASGTVEHKLTLGLFDGMGYAEQHPLLQHHNATGIKVFITSAVADPDALLWAIDELYTETFGKLRDLNADLNQRADPREVLQNGMGVLATLPAPFAAQVDQLLIEQSIGHQMVPTDPKIGGCALLAFDDSYMIARSFAVQILGLDE